MNPCRITEDLLPLYVDGTLSEDSREYVETHLNECGECRKLHTAMKKSVEIVLSRKNAQNSFKAFKRKVFWRKFLLTTLCAFVALALLGVALYKPIDAFLNHPFTMSMEPFEISAYCQTEGRVDVDIVYSEEQGGLFHQGFEVDFLPDEPETVFIRPYYTRMGQIDRWLNHTFGTGTLTSGGGWHMSFTTDPDAAADSESPFVRRCSKILFIGSDGERVLWENGDILPEYSPWSNPAATPVPSAALQPEQTAKSESTPSPLPTAFPAATGAADAP